MGKFKPYVRVRFYKVCISSCTRIYDDQDEGPFPYPVRYRSCDNSTFAPLVLAQSFLFAAKFRNIPVGIPYTVSFTPPLCHVSVSCGQDLRLLW